MHDQGLGAHKPDQRNDYFKVALLGPDGDYNRLLRWPMSRVWSRRA